MSSWRQFVTVWLCVGIYIVALFLLIILQGVLDSAKILSFQASWPYFMVAHVVVMIVFFYFLARTFSSPAVREARQNGLPATAEILEATQTGWRTPRRRRGIRIVIGKGLPNPRRWEYKLRMRVNPPVGDPYEVTTFEYIVPSQQPTVGMTIPVRIHPKYPKVVVLAETIKQS